MRPSSRGAARSEARVGSGSPIHRAMPPKAKVLESGDLGHGITYEVRPASKGSPTVHVVIDGERLPAFRRKSDSSVEEQIRALPLVQAKLAAPPSAAEEQQPRERSRSPIFNGSSLQREGAALRKDLDRKVMQPLLVAENPPAEHLVLSYTKLYSDDGWCDLRGVWAKQNALVNGRPAYTFAYSWDLGNKRCTVLPDGSRHRTVMWFAPVAARAGGAGEAMPGWIIGLDNQLGQGHEERPVDHGCWLVNTDRAPLPDLIRIDSPWRLGQSRKWTIRCSRMPDPPVNVVLYRHPDHPGLIYERAANSASRRHFDERRCFSRRQPRPLRLQQCSWHVPSDPPIFLVRCNEVESACYWRRRQCHTWGKSGPIDGGPLADGEVQLEACFNECGVFFCETDCRLRTRCPHFENETIDYRVSNALLASGCLLCDCECCERRMEPPVCDACYELPCTCEGQSDWKGLHGKLWALMHPDAPEQTPVRQNEQKRPWCEAIKSMTPEEQCEKFCVGRMAKYGCRVCKPGLRLLVGLSDSESSSNDD